VTNLVTNNSNFKQAANQSTTYKAIAWGAVSVAALGSGGYVAIVAVGTGLKLTGIFISIIGTSSLLGCIKSWEQNPNNYEVFYRDYKNITVDTTTKLTTDVTSKVLALIVGALCLSCSRS